MIKFNPNQIFVITGATSGIGAAVALAINSWGGVAICIGRNQSAFEELKRKAKEPNLLYFEQKDLTEDINTLPDFMKTLSRKYGKLSGVVCSAGITDTMPLRGVNLASMKHLFDIDYFVPIMMAKGFADKSVNVGAGASFVSVASIAGARPSKGQLAYGGAKEALVSSMIAIAKEYASSGIRFNTVSPSAIETPMTQNIPEIMDKFRAKYPMGFGRPSDVGNLIVFLLSDAARWITGQNYIVDCASC